MNTQIAQWFDFFGAAMEYATDAAQRGILFWDVMRKRGNQYLEHSRSEVPHVLNFKGELVLDGRTFARPVNYALVRILPPPGVEVDLSRRPFVVFDPRAGHGPGIGGFKADSEIGVALRAGHPCYFVGFLPEPMLGQTILDIADAEAKFLEKVIQMHPSADGKPCTIGNCQAGWALMIVAATRPELFGPIIIAGAPLSYWGGVHGKYPMRYSGGLLGGSWLTALCSDLGHGKFDGAWLVRNFENQNPANTLWSKQYNLYRKIDTEPQRYLDFERYWGGYVYLNAEEIQFIVDKLFIGNKLSAGLIKDSNNVAVDLRNIRSPIVVFCSRGDNITPPQQALGWILDLYDDVDEIRAQEQTIVYTIHDSIGHLGIFVAGSVARKEHTEFSSNIDFIDILPPGLYEATFEPRTSDSPDSEFVANDWIMRCEARSLDDIRALGGNDADDERRFEAATRLSDVNLMLYRTFAQPFVQALVPSAVADMLRNIHPLRLQYEIWSDANPLMTPVRIMAESIGKVRKPASGENPFTALQESASNSIISALNSWRDLVEGIAEQTFLAIYGSPQLQAALGIDPTSEAPMRKIGKSALYRDLLRDRIQDLRSRMTVGSFCECMVRSLVYVGMARNGADERTFDAIRRFRQQQKEGPQLTLEQFKTLIRDQYYMLLIDEEAALAAIPALLPKNMDMRQDGFSTLSEVLSAAGELSGTVSERLEHIAFLFGIGNGQRSKASKDIKKSKAA